MGLESTDQIVENFSFHLWDIIFACCAIVHMGIMVSTLNLKFSTMNFHYNHSQKNSGRVYSYECLHSVNDSQMVWISNRPVNSGKFLTYFQILS